jgi:hypothetical protein
LLAGLLNYSSTLKMEAIRSSETSGTTQRTTRCHIPEEDTLRKPSIKFHKQATDKFNKLQRTLLGMLCTTL